MKKTFRSFASFVKRHKIASRLMSLTLSLVMLFYVIPTVVYAEIGDAFSGENASGSSSLTKDNDTLSLSGNDTFDANYPLHEVTELRSKNSKHFRLSDGSYIAAQYSSDVHYLDKSGLWQDIDNSLSLNGDELLTADSRIKLAKKINGSGKLLSLKNESYSIDLGVIGAEHGSVGIVTENDDSSYATELQKMLNLERLSSKVTYPEIFSGADMELSVFSYRIEEKITVTRKSDSYAYSFELKLKGLSASLSEEGSVVLSDDESGSAVYVLSLPTLVDASGSKAPKDAAAYTLSGNGEKYFLTLTLDEKWMNDTSRSYPVSVSPFYSASETDADSGYETTSLEIGGVSVTYVKINDMPSVPEGSYVAKVLLNLSDELPDGAYGLYEVTSDWSSETLTYESYLSGEGKISESITDSTTESYEFNITELADKWTNEPESNYGVAIMSLSNENNGSRATTLAYSARSSSTPTVSAVYSSTEGLEDYLSYTSQSVGAAGNVSINNATGHLTLAIPTVSNNNEVMPLTITPVYNSYLSGKSYVSANASVPFEKVIMPYGFKVNVTESVLEKKYVDENGNTKVYYLYEDADGTTHAFFETSNPGEYTDNDGLQKKLTLNSTKSELYITDDSKITKRFLVPSGFSPTAETTGAWVLNYSLDGFGNRILITTHNYHGIPEQATFTSGGISSASIYVMSIGFFNKNTKEFAVMRFSADYNGEVSTSGEGKYLRQIDFGYGNENTTNNTVSAFYRDPTNKGSLTVTRTAKYEYDSLGRITKIEDVTLGQSITYTWDNSNRVIKVTQYADEVKGQEISFSYGAGYTDVRNTGNDEILNTSDDILTRYIFDERGRCISMYSYSEEYMEIYGATVGKYETQENVKNNLKEKTVVGGSSVNYLLNGDFENKLGTNNFANWTLYGEAYEKKPSLNTHGYYSLSLKPSAGATAYAEQYVFLESGTYTLSFPVFSQYADGHEARAEITSISGSGLSHNEEISLSPNGSTGIRSTFSTTFNVSSYTNGGDVVRIRIYLSALSSAPRKAVFEIDDVALSKGIGAAEYSYVKYGTFNESGRTSGAAVSTSMSQLWQTSTGTSPTIVDSNSPFGKAVRVNANNTTSYVKQRIYEIDQSHLDTYDYDYSMYFTNAKYGFVISGFAKADSASLSENAKFELKVDVVYYQGVNREDVVITHTFEFLPTADDWQFICGSFDTVYERQSGDNNNYKCIKAIDIYCDYSNQSSGYALFDNISVVNSTDHSIQKYYYYSEGSASGLLAMTETLTYNEYYFYNDDRNLITFANNKGEVTKYEYNHATNPDIVTSSVDYDFTYFGSYDYPHKNGDSLQYLTETPKTKTEYTYEAHGLCTDVVTYEVEYASDMSVVRKSGSSEVSERYTYAIYDTTGYLLNRACFGAVITSTDTLGVTTRNFYDSVNGRLLATVNENTGDGLAYTYDTLGNFSGVNPARYVSSSQYNTIMGEESVSYEYNANGLLGSIATNSTAYTFNYDAFGNSSSVNIGSTALASYEYNTNNGKLKKINYGNGFSVEYVYNRLEMLSEIWYNENGTRTLAYSYEYTDDGQVYKFTDNKSGKAMVYKYDTVGKLTNFAEYDVDDMYYEFSSEIMYSETTGKVSNINYQLNYDSTVQNTTNPVSYYYARHPDGKIDYVKMSTKATGGKETYIYDSYDRLSGKTAWMYDINDTSSTPTNEFRSEYSYTFKSNASGTQTSALIESYKSKINGNDSFVNTYTYDSNGNITKIRYNDSTEIRYYYDDLSQLVREDNVKIGKTYLYEYDNAGNITAVKTCYLAIEGETPTVISTNTYSYSTGSWGDLLTSYKGTAITYDEIGNPVSYFNGSSYTFTWSGRQLVGAVKGNDTFTFTYNEEGIRTSKTKNGVTTTYYLNGSRIMAEETNGNLTVYLYDESGSPIGMQYHAATAGEYEWEVYWYEKNLQGDIVAVYSETGQLLISYKYTAYGTFWMSQSNGGFSTQAANNPFTYRGYYFDRDLNLYCLGTRYYDYNTCRFINADVMMSGANGSLDGYNLFVYCFNNPVMLTDEDGAWPKWAKKLAKAAKAVAEVVVDVTVKIVVASAESVEIQVGAGLGFDIKSGNFEIGNSRDNYIGFDDGKIVTGTRISNGISWGDKKSISLDHDDLSEKGGERVGSPASSTDNALSMLLYPETRHSLGFETKWFTFNSEGDVLLGPKAKSKHIIFGGFYSVKFNLTEFLERISE